MPQKRKRHSPQVKAKVALEATRGLKTVRELAQEYQVHPTQINQWKKQLMEHLPTLFEMGSKQAQESSQDADAALLYEEIGRLKVELDWLKKSAAKLHG